MKEPKLVYTTKLCKAMQPKHRKRIRLTTEQKIARDIKRLNLQTD